MKIILVLTVFNAVAFTIVRGGHLTLRPVPASEVRRILRLAGHEDAVPEGRVISHGIAAVSGFTLGFKKGVLGVAIADGLAAAGNIGSGSNSNGSGGVSYNSTSNEICFTSRSATSDIVGSGEMDGRAVTTATGLATTGTTPTLSSTGAASPTTANTATNTGTGTGTNSATDTSTVTQTGGGTVNCIVLNKS